MTIGFDQRLYILPFDQRESFQTKMFGWEGTLSAAQTAEIAAAKQVIYDGFEAAIAGGAPKEHAAILPPSWWTSSSAPPSCVTRPARVT